MDRITIKHLQTANDITKTLAALRLLWLARFNALNPIHKIKE